jgi:purine-binding chemotaxis protein CheW
LGDEIYGLDISNVTEIIGMQEITRVPDVPKFMRGVINLRGKIIPVIDVRLKFKKEEAEYDDRTCIIVVDITNVPVGLIVDNVDEVLSIADEEIAAPPSAKTGFDNKYIKGIGRYGNQVQLLLNCFELFEEEELAKAAEIH